ncbi:3'(2'),5'-bisphosphate nucleotidase [Dispira simplex]|nr:3'(2'),5'-bisphosphate nucleotidase [Dispira simplex]
MSPFLALERKAALEAVTRACRVCQKVFRQLASSETMVKSDHSPVTVADYSAQAVVSSILADRFPLVPIVGEENSQALQGEASRTLRQRVLELTNSVLDHPVTEHELCSLIDLGTYAGGATGQHWTLDPVDGTKGFLRGDQYAVCLALIINGEVQLGVMGCPNLPKSFPSAVGDSRGCLFVTVRGQGAFQRALDSDNETPVRVSELTNSALASFCESYEADHSSHADALAISKRLGITNPSLRMDSQCKYGCIARGDADIYLRIPTNPKYVEKIWDHATGSLLVTEAGGKVTDVDGKPLDFSQGRLLTCNRGVVATNASLHTQVQKAVQDQLSQ